MPEDSWKNVGESTTKMLAEIKNVGADTSHATQTLTPNPHRHTAFTARAPRTFSPHTGEGRTAVLGKPSGHYPLQGQKWEMLPLRWSPDFQCEPAVAGAESQR